MTVCELLDQIEEDLHEGQVSLKQIKYWLGQVAQDLQHASSKDRSRYYALSNAVQQCGLRQLVVV